MSDPDESEEEVVSDTGNTSRNWFSTSHLATPTSTPASLLVNAIARAPVKTPRHHKISPRHSLGKAFTAGSVLSLSAALARITFELRYDTSGSRKTRRSCGRRNGVCGVRLSAAAAAAAALLPTAAAEALRASFQCVCKFVRANGEAFFIQYAYAV